MIISHNVIVLVAELDRYTYPHAGSIVDALIRRLETATPEERQLLEDALNRYHNPPPPPPLYHR